jgi:ABC-type sugar transport system ATPase subunit
MLMLRRLSRRVAPAEAASAEPQVPLGSAVLEAEHVTKRFGVTLALDDVSVTFRAGEIHALLGENGAGKTTLTRIIAGVESPDGGELRYLGEPFRHASPAAALVRGIGLVHQELSLIPSLSVGANVYLGREPRTMRGTVDDRTIERKTTEILRYVGASCEANELVDALPLAEQQLVEIARILDRKPRLLIMDEPTASLARESVSRLFEIMRELRDAGTAIVYISHEIQEVFEVADRVTVLRDGRVTMSAAVADTEPDEVVRMMVGRKLEALFPPRPEGRLDTAAPALEVSDLSLPGHFENVSFALHPGEVIGLAGLIGAGRSALVQTLFGAPPAPLTSRDVHGSIRINGRDGVPRRPEDAIERGLGLVPEDRKTEGLLLTRALSENIALPQLRGLATYGVVRPGAEARVARAQIERLRIVTPSHRVPARSLSGGNQQKVVLAKWLAKRCPILLLDEPTRGVDIGAKTEFYAFVRQLAENGTAVLFISSSLPEILGLSDRILVMRRGRIAAEHTPEEASEETLLAAALGLAREERPESEEGAP